MARRLALAVLLLTACDNAPDPMLDAGPAPRDAATDSGPELHPERYPVDPRSWTAETCAEDQAAHWRTVVDPACASGRLCIDGRGRTFQAGAPLIVRGVYHGGRELDALLTNCPAGAACEATQPADEAAYLATLADAGINVLLEHHEALSPNLRAALDAQPLDTRSRIGVAHLLFDDPFTPEGHDRLVTSIETAAADENVWLFFGPDEPDLNGTWPMAAGIKRILRGASPELDALLELPRYRPSAAAPFLPSDQPAHDPHGLPYASAVVIDDTGLAVATDLYDLRVPVTYPFQELYSRADDSLWTIARISRYDEPDSPTMPVLQMVELEGLNLIRPTPGQIRAQIFGAIVHGATGAYYFKLAGDDPSFAGRAGWFAADDVDAWTAYTETHARWDALVPVLYSDAEQTRGSHDVLHWRRYTLGDRRVVLVVNPTPYRRWVDLDAMLERQPNERVRQWTDCASVAARAIEVEPYAALAYEVVSVTDADAGDPGDPLAGTVAPRPEPPTASPLSTWTTEPALGVARSSHLALSADALSLVGGYTGALTASDSVATYPDGAALDDLPVPVASAAGMRTDDGALIVAGGVPRFPTDTVVFPRLHCQRFEGGAWSRCADLGNGPTTNAAFLDYFGDLYLFGGLVHVDPAMGNVASTVVQRYAPSEDEWRAETHMPSLRVGAAAMQHAGVAYLVGGFAQASPSAPVALTGEVLAYDLHTQRWLETGVAALPTPRANLACIAHAGYGYCVGGFEAGGDNLAVVERLDFATGVWTRIDPLPQPLSDVGVAIWDDRVYVTGGLTATFVDSSAVYALAP